MSYVYRYRDKEDGVIKYVGIVVGNNLDRRIEQHENDAWCLAREWSIDYIDLGETAKRTDCEWLEAHYISEYHTDQHFNKNKSGWGKSLFVPSYIDALWKPYEKQVRQEMIFNPPDCPDDAGIQQVDFADAFLRNCFTADARARTERKQVYAMYSRFCDSLGFMALGRNKFYSRLKSVMHGNVVKINGYEYFPIKQQTLSNDTKQSIIGYLDNEERSRVCAIEIWRDALKKDGKPSKWQVMQINDYIDSTGKWTKLPYPFKHGIYGSQRGFVRKECI